MEILLSILIVLIFMGMFLLIEKESFQNNHRWYKNLIAILFGCFTIISTPIFINFINMMQSQYLDEIIFEILSYIAYILMPTISIIVAMNVYYKCCNKTKFGIFIGYAFYFFMAALSTFNIYYYFVYENNIIEGLSYILAISIGLTITITISINKFKESEEDNLEVEEYIKPTKENLVSNMDSCLDSKKE